MASSVHDITTKVYDREFRNQLQQAPQFHVKDLLGEDYDAGVKYSVSVSNKDTTYISIPYWQGDTISLSGVAATGKTSSAGSAGSASTLGCICGCASTATTLGTAGTVSTTKS